MYLKELWYRKFNFALGLVGVVTLVALVVAFYTMMQAAGEETRKLTRDMGFNVRIIPETTDMNDFWKQGYADVTMSEAVVDRLVDKKSVNYAHLTATLHKRIQWRDKEVMLSGISSQEREPFGAKKSKMIFAIPEDVLYMGYEIHKTFGIEEGDKIEVLGKEFAVAKVLSEAGSEDDVRLFMDLKTLQNLLGMQGRINEVMAINCMCSTKNGEPLKELRSELRKIAPNAKVIMKSNVANAREKQRKMADRYFGLLFPFLLLVCAIWLGTVTMTNVNDRMAEIGILRALGFSFNKTLWLFLKRILFIGLLGSLIGFCLGTYLAYEVGEAIFFVAKGFVKPNYQLLLYALVIGPVFAMITGLIPIVWALTKDPSHLLKQS